MKPLKHLVIVFFCCLMSSNLYATDWITSTAGDITVLSNWTNGATSPSTFSTYIVRAKKGWR